MWSVRCVLALVVAAAPMAAAQAKPRFASRWTLIRAVYQTNLNTLAVDRLGLGWSGSSTLYRLGTVAQSG